MPVRSVDCADGAAAPAQSVLDTLIVQGGNFTVKVQLFNVGDRLAARP